MFQPWQLPFLFATGLVAGFVDSIAGGGGLITLPVLLNLGGDPGLVFGTNKLQATCGSGSAAWHYARAGTVPLRDCARVFLITLIMAALGAIVLQRLALQRPDLLRKGVPIVLILIALYALMRPQLGWEDRHPKMPRPVFDLLFGVLLGFYDGFFGPGTGTFWTIAFVVCLGFNLTKATGYTKVVNLASNVGALTLFLWHRNVDFAAGLTMGAGQLLGARVGSKMVVKRGAKFIRPIFISMVIAVTLKLVYDAYLRPPG
jgi:uncharacterized membrane protein YfcA